MPHFVIIHIPTVRGPKDVRTEETAAYARSIVEGIKVTSARITCDSVLYGDYTTAVRYTNASDLPVRFRTGADPNPGIRVTPRFVDTLLAPATSCTIPSTLSFPDTALLEQIGFPTLSWQATFTPEGYGECTLEESSPFALDARYRCPAAVSRVKVDGDIGEWGPMRFTVTNRKSIRYEENWEGPDDATLAFSVARTPRLLLIAVRVIDDEVITDSTKQPWQQDAVSVLLDARPVGERMDGLGMGEQFKSHLLFYVSPAEKAADTHVYKPELLAEGCKIAALRVSDGYTVEIGVPVAYLDERQGGR